MATIPATEHAPRAGHAPSTVAAAVAGRRRFTVAVAWGLGAALVPYLWVLTDLWNWAPSPIRKVPPGFFYDFQARSMFHGHLFVPKGALGIEGFIHGAHEYTYFGLFPSILRMPVLLFTSRLDGELTVPSMLLSWIVAGVFTSLLLWRVRVLARGDAALGRLEATCYGIFVAVVGAGSVLLYLGATPFVYNEDFSWSVALTVASLFALIGVLERPSWWRVAGAGALIVLTNLNRTPAGYAMVIGAGLVAVWFGLGRGGEDRRRWALPMGVAAAVPFAISCAVTYGKFGIPIGLPMADQVWARVNAHRREFLAANGGKAFSPGFLPSTLVAYVQPFGIRFSGVFPFISTPSAPAAAHAGAVLDQTYPTASLPPTTPLLVLAGLWGVVTAFRPGPTGRLALVRIPLVAALAGTAGVLMWGYIATRYGSDFMPFFILAAAVGLVDLLRRLEGRSLRVRRLAFGGLAVLAAYSVAANLAIAIEPSPQFTGSQLVQYIDAQRSLTPGALESTVHVGSTLPFWAPEGELYIVGQCSGLYYSTGQTYKDVPGQQLMHWTWVPVQEAPGIVHIVDVTFNVPQRDIAPPVPIFTYGGATLFLEQGPDENMQLQLLHAGADSLAFPSPIGGAFPVIVGQGYQFEILADPNTHAFEVWQDGSKVLGHYIAGSGPGQVIPSPVSGHPKVEVTEVTGPAQGSIGLCRSLLRGA